jgi:type II secretory pathway pseudopilin PulG
MLKLSPSQLRNSQGLTLIEILIVAVMLGVLGSGLLTLQYIVGKNQITVVKNYLNVDKANSLVTTFIRELRIARTGDNAAYALETTDDFEIVFYSDIDHDGQTEKIRYTLSGNQLVKGVIEPTAHPVDYPADQETVKVLSSQIRNDTTPAFYYYNDDWPQDTINNPLMPSARLSNTKTVRIYLQVNTEEDDPDSDYILESYVSIRMLKDNL